MIARLDELPFDSSEDVALPIHPAVTLEEWVGIAHIAIIEQSLTREQTDELMDQINENPAALAYFTEFCIQEALMSRYFNVYAPTERELPEAVASPIW